MHKTLALGLLTATLLAACAGTPPAPPPAASPAAQQPATVSVRLISLNDFHGNLEPQGLSLPWPDPANPQRSLRLAAGGAAAVAGTVEALRNSPLPEAPGQARPHSVLISAGDHIGGTPLVSALFRHESTMQVLNQMGMDLAALGNHEFDAGREELLRIIQGGCAQDAPQAMTRSCALQPYAGARFPNLAANIETTSGQPLVPASVVKRFDGVSVGFIGAVTRSTPNIVLPSGVAGLRFTDEATAINREAERLLAQGVRALVAVIHEGGNTGGSGQPTDWNDPTCPQARGAVFDIVKRLHPEVDVVFSGHTHQGYRCLIDGRPVMQATALGRGLSVADITIDRQTGDVLRERTRSRNLPVFNETSDATLRAAIIAAEPAPWAEVLGRVRSDSPLAQAVAQTVRAYSAAAAPLVQRPVGRIGGVFERGGKTDSSAGRLIADAQWLATRAPEQGGAQFALMNPGGVRSDLRCGSGTPPCTVTYGDAFTMQPFGNSLVVMTLTGEQLQRLLEDQQRPGRAAPSFLIPSAQLRYRWVAGAPHGQRVQDLRVNGQAVNPAAEYRFTVNSFLADGGDGQSMLAQGRNRLGGALDIDALIAHLQSGPSPDPLPRVTWVD